MATKIKKVKAKSHKASTKRFKLTAGGKLMHIGQGGGNGHARNYKNRRQRIGPAKERGLSSSRETAKIKRLMGI